jgi:hypothetical protein
VTGFLAGLLVGVATGIVVTFVGVIILTFVTDQQAGRDLF